MESAFANFVLARPLWLWALLPVLLALALFIKKQISTEQWNNHIDPELLDNLIAPSSSKSNQYVMPLLATCLSVFIILGLSGPSFQSDQVQSVQSDDTLVIVLDLSLSMTAEDVKPSRLQRAQFKIQDLLDQRSTGHTALVVYSGDAHVVVPLTEDAETIKHLAKSLNPWMIPSKGSRVYRAIEEANKLLDAYPSSNSRILLFTDEISDKQLSKTLDISKYPTYVIGVGTEAGAPIHLPDRKLLKDRNQNIVVAKFNDEQPQALASETGGQYKKLSVANGDISPALNYNREGSNAESDEGLTALKDFGYLVIIPALFLMLLSFRRGWLLLPLIFILQPADSFAFSWEDAWKNDQQRAQQAYNEGRYADSAALFEDPVRKGNALAKADQWEDAENAFSQSSSAIAKYNQANAQAHQGKLDDAIESYQTSIEQAKQEDNQQIVEQAAKDIDLLNKLKEQQKDQENQQGQDGEQSQDGQQDDSNSQDQQGSDSQNSDSQKSEDQQSGQQNSENQSDSDQNSEQQSGQESEQQSQAQSDKENNDNSDAQSGSEDQAELDDQQAEEAAKKAQASEEQRSQNEQLSEEQAAQQQAAQQQEQAPTDDEVFDYQNAQSSKPMPLTEEQKEEEKYQQILRKIQTDPSLLLENKFRIQHYQRKQPANEAQVW